MFGIFKRSRKYQDLDAASFRTRIYNDKDAVVIDVRTYSEYKTGHIPWAINIDVSHPNFPSMISRLDVGKNYFVYCLSGERSVQACEILASQGYKVFNLTGGINAWSFEIA